MQEPNVYLNAADCLALIECLDRVPTVGLNAQRRNLMLEAKLMHLGRSFGDLPTPAEQPSGDNPFDDEGTGDAESTDG